MNHHGKSSCTPVARNRAGHIVLASVDKQQPYQSSPLGTHDEAKSVTTRAARRFGGSAWERCEKRGQYYYHSFLVEQPALNWRNHEVRAALADIMRFWLNRGVFRIDASAVLIKNDLLRDNVAFRLLG